MSARFARFPDFAGKFRSRSVDDLVAESRRLAEQGVRELVIVSQDTMAYGKDLGMANGITTLLRRAGQHRWTELGPIPVLLSATWSPTNWSGWLPKKNGSASISIFPISTPAGRYWTA